MAGVRVAPRSQFVVQLRHGTTQESARRRTEEAHHPLPALPKETWSARTHRPHAPLPQEGEVKHPKVKIGDVFTRLTVIAGPVSHPYKHGGTYLTWTCRCVCGAEREVRGAVLVTGNTRSCGCIRKGHEVRPETRAKIGAGNRGKERSPELRKHLSEKTQQYFERLGADDRKAWATAVADKHASLPIGERQKRKQRLLEAGNNTRFSNGHKGYQYWLGKPRTKETKDKLRAAGKANPVNYWKGREFTEEMRRNMSKARKGKFCGPNHPNWKGGTTKAKREARAGVEWTTWRKAVYKRDNHTCIKCHKRGGKLSPHHILNWSSYRELRYDVDNGAALCHKHHSEFHKIYGVRNNSIEQLEEFLRGY